MKRKMMLAVLMCGVCMSAAAMGAAAEETDAVEETEVADEDVAEEETEPQIVELGEKPEYNALDYVTVGEYKGLAVETQEVTVTDEEIDSAVQTEIESLVEDNELFTKAEGTVEEGDIANIDYVGKIDDEAFDGGTGSGYDLEIGSGTFIDGFEDQLIGVATGDTVDVNVTFPDDYYSEDLAGKDAVFTCTVNYIKEMPELTDQLVSDATDGEYTTIDAYREFERGVLEEQYTTDQESEINTELMTQLYNTCPVSGYPQDVVDYSVQSAENYYISMAEAYGMTFDDLLSAFGLADEDAFISALTESVESSLQQEMILKAVADTEGITVSDEEYQEGAQGYADSMGYDSVESLEEDYSKADIEASLLMDKTMTMVRENAVITYAEEETEDYELVLTDDETENIEDMIVVDETETAES